MAQEATFTQHIFDESIITIDAVKIKKGQMLLVVAHCAIIINKLKVFMKIFILLLTLTTLCHSAEELDDPSTIDPGAPLVPRDDLGEPLVAHAEEQTDLLSAQKSVAPILQDLKSS